MCTMEFAHLHMHSSFSFHAGVASVHDIVGRARDLGMPAVGLTDTDRMSGLILHYEACRAAGIRPVLGVELTEPRLGEILAAEARHESHQGGPADSRRTPRGSHKSFGAGVDAAEMAPRADAAGSHARERLVLLARNAEGYAELCDVLTQRHLAADRFCFEDIFTTEWPNLYLLSTSPGLLGTLAATPNRDRLFGELVHNSAGSRRRSRQLEAVACAIGVPLVASNDSYFLDRDDASTHEILTAIGLNSTVSRLRPGECAPPDATFRSASQMQQVFDTHPAALANSVRLAEECGDIQLDLGKWIMPRVEVPAGHTPESHLAELAWAGYERNYGGKPEARRARQIQQMELETIEKLGYPSYFLIVKEIRDWANKRFATGYRTPQIAPFCGEVPPPV